MASQNEEVVVVSRPREVRDPIHDMIILDARVWAYVDTRHFQRLRYIKQLGTSYYVWPGASHNRFEHSLGVAYLARRMAEHLQKSQPELKITDRDVHCVELAGLCHDLGHGPWSHVWDGLFIPKALKGKKWAHEDASEMMFDDLIEKNKKRINISAQDANFVKALIAGDQSRCDPPEKSFLFEIVANKRNGIDVDKFDYIMRDTHAVGDKGNLSLPKLINSARVVDNQICYDIKDANQLYELCYTRFSLHKRIYNHKTAKAIEYMLIDALLAAEPYMKIANKIEDPNKYIYLTDDIMQRIESSEEPELAKSRAILNRLHERDLYKCVDYKVFSWDQQDDCRRYITPEAIVHAAKRAHKQSNFDVPPESLDDEGDGDFIGGNIGDLKADHVFVALSPMHYGMKHRSPLDFIKFYSKHNPNQCTQASPGDVSLLMPAVFGEVMLRVYTREAKYFGIVQAGYRAVLQEMADSEMTSGLASSEMDNMVLTPPATEMPSTPKRPFSRTASLNSHSFTTNSFTTVPPEYDPSISPVLGGRKPRSKRFRESAEGGGSPQRKKRAGNA